MCGCWIYDWQGLLVFVGFIKRIVLLMLFLGGMLTSKCNPESSKGFITKFGRLCDRGENLASLDSFDADLNIVYTLDQFECFDGQR